MKKPKKAPVREERIENEAIADANGPEEQVMGWYYYLDDKIRFPLQAKCIVLGLQQANVPAAKYIVADFGAFDPKHPEPLPAAFDLPPDPGAGRGGRGPRKPAGGAAAIAPKTP